MIKSKKPKQLISYMVPGAPATRRPATSDLPFMRAEIGFLPRWYRQHLDTDFGQRWHETPEYRQESLRRMRQLLRERFAGTTIGQIHEAEGPLDLLTGTYGVTVISSVFGVPMIFGADHFPNYQHQELSAAQAEALTIPDLEKTPFFQRLLSQLDVIEKRQGQIIGYLNLQGVLCNALRVRGEGIFRDMTECPQRAHHVLEVMCETMIAVRQRVQERQRQSGAHYWFATVSNDAVRRITPAQYGEFILPYDQRISQKFGYLGMHNGAWTADAYLDYYAQVPKIGYIDMGLESDLKRAKELFSHARRAVLYAPEDFLAKTPERIRQDLERIAREYAPCDVVLADVDAGTPDDKIMAFWTICDELSR